MAVVKGALGGYTPICDQCGVSICWDISEFEYIENKAFWDKYCCKECNPNYKGALQRFIKEKEKKPS